MTCVQKEINGHSIVHEMWLHASKNSGCHLLLTFIVFVVTVNVNVYEVSLSLSFSGSGHARLCPSAQSRLGSYWVLVHVLRVRIVLHVF